MTVRSIHWFRKGLRIHDNPALIEACKGAEDVKPVFILDPWFTKNANVGVNRWRFLMQSLEDLDRQLKSVNSRYMYLIILFSLYLIGLKLSVYTPIVCSNNR